MKQKFSHLILTGGGLGGMAYIGIYRFFKEHNILKDVHYMTGISIGALFVFLFGLNIDYDKIENMFMCKEGVCYKSALVEFNPANLLNIRANNGLYTTERFRPFIVAFLKDKYDIEDITFSEYIKLTGVDIHISSTCLNTHSHLDLCNDTFPEMSVITAILASMSIPVAFQPVIYKDMILVDGGCCDNLDIYNVVKNKLNKALYISLEPDITFTNEQLQNNFMLYGLSIMLSMITSSHTKKIIEDYKDQIDIIHLQKNPIQFIQGVFENDMFYAVIEKKQLEECIIFGYKYIHSHFELKSYL
jgi:predicted acylesterase/phospholipase RssA